MTQNNCTHEHTTLGLETGYIGTVAREPYTDPNPAAAGSISYTETCDTCGAERHINQNQHHFEFGPWSADRATRDQWARDAARDTAAREYARRIEAGNQTMRETQTQVGAIQRDGCVNLFVRGERKIVPIDEVRAAAEQDDNGDGLVPYYMAVLDVIERRIADDYDAAQARL